MMQRGHKGDYLEEPLQKWKEMSSRVAHKLPLFGVEGMSQRRRRHLDTPYRRVRGAFVH